MVMADLSRRRFLQASVLASSAMLLPGVMQAAWA
ncbi:twin-arginine translocation signal domain-containing protein, partial [Enterobacter cloacae subsp. cloacae]